MSLRLTGGSQERAQEVIDGWTKWERQGVLWQGMRKPAVIAGDDSVWWSVVADEWRSCCSRR